MKINLRKAKVIKIDEVKVMIEGILLQQVDESCYLGSLITEGAKYSKEVQS